jgi:capsular polysaccharide transport system permease protein
MIERIKELPGAAHARRLVDKIQDSLAPSILRRRTFVALAAVILGAILYWGLVASDRYVSEAAIIIERTDMAAGTAMDIGSLITGATGGQRSDQLLLRAHLRSIDMLNKIDAQLDLRGHYSDTGRDPLSRMWGKERNQEIFHEHYLSRTSIELDEYSGVLVIKAQAYDAKMAKAIADLLVVEGERYMNELGHAMARDQVSFLEKQVAEMGAKTLRARQDLLAFQNQKGLLSPQAMAEAKQVTISRLEAQATDLKARRASLLGYLSPDAPGVVDLNLQIQATERQIAEEQALLTSPKGKTLNTTVEEFQRLELTAKFTQDVYQTALVALERGRLEAARTLKKVSVLQAPSLPQYPREPRRIYNIIVSIIAVLTLAGIIHLLAAIIRDHLD